MGTQSELAGLDWSLAKCSAPTPMQAGGQAADRPSWLPQPGSSEMGELQPVPTSLLWCKCRMTALPEQRGTKGSVELSHRHLPCVPCRLNHSRSTIRMQQCVLSWTFLGSENGFRGFFKRFCCCCSKYPSLIRNSM